MLVVVPANLELVRAIVLHYLRVYDLEEGMLRQPTHVHPAVHIVQDARLQRREQLGDLTAAEAVEPPCGLREGFEVYRLSPRCVVRIVDLAPPGEEATKCVWRRRHRWGLFHAVRGHLAILAILRYFSLCLVLLTDPRPHGLELQRLGDVHLVVKLYHALASSHIGQAKLDAFVKAIEYGTIKVARSVGRDDQHELRRRRTRMIKDGGQRIPQGLAHVALLPRGQEGVGLVDEEQHSSAAAVYPLEKFVELGHGLLLKRRHVATGHDRVL
mmetsp:Transcript_44144/g.93989  ORF Transcript_44144/g.93989 Transcript_44144/m.93989 type:complete len:270 (+) Transcript_44144:106-915(+)